MIKKTACVIISLLFILTLCSCTSTTQDAANNKKITLCLEWTPNTNHTGFYVAQAKGYYEEVGLSVTIVQPPENGAALMCASGQAQFAIDGQDTIAQAFATDDPLGVTAVAAILQHNTSGIISRKGEGIESPKGLEGKTYSTWDIPTELAMLRSAVEADGGDFSKVKLIPNVITDEAGALKNGDTDAVWVFYGWGGINAEVSGLDFDYFNFTDINGIFDYYTPVIIANNDFLKDDPEAAKAFLSATAKGYGFAAEYPQAAAQMLIDGDDTGSLMGCEKLVVESQKWLSAQYFADTEQWGFIDAERWDGFYNWLWENELIERPLPPGTGFTNDYLG